ncbi:MAG: DUF1080 domain-containing protein [Cyclobacteriaceae bacterium]|nr:DUF1080 domain-containing protein [Cyclobacteriaceae bacterium]
MLSFLKTYTGIGGMVLALLLFTRCNTTPKPVEEEVPPVTLPMKMLSMDNLNDFRSSGENWQLAGDALAGLEDESPLQPLEGRGVIVNVPTETAREHLFTKFEHGDIELEVEFLMPKNSNSGIYFQGRYEIQLFDSWNVKNPKHADCGGIYQRWDESKPDGEKGYEGHPPQVNASKAPGLWQNFRISFRAPRFDDSGNKTENARFESVYHNGFLIHENVELTGPTRSSAFEDEQPQGPLMIQGDHGPVAIRNIRYKTYTQDSLHLSGLQYAMYDGNWTTMPNLLGLEAIKTGTSDVLEASPDPDKKDHYALEYTGTLHVPVEGTYLFETHIDDGGELFIDDQLVVFNDGDPGWGLERGLIKLKAGAHPFKMTYFQDVWGATLEVYYEGPGISRKALAAVKRKSVSGNRPAPLMIDSLTAPEMIRSFAEYGDGPTKTHVISVGDPAGVHYTYNLHNGALLKVWRGTFADVTGMWVNRGGSQLLRPGNAALETTDGPQVAKLENAEAPWPDSLSTAFKYEGYEVNSDERPVFLYTYEGVSFADLTQPTKDGLFTTRIITATTKNPVSNLWFRIAKANKIDVLGDGTYRIGGQYYLSLSNEEAAIVREGKELLIPIASAENISTIQYTLIW